ncbi:MAG TPA: polyphenol oxidase family protein [Solirubrobacteraceae bacterium]|jgi:YfiH family protein|nr:polyphenol oxidase family protein [Solirubrobacteraceae bacterium]
MDIGERFELPGGAFASFTGRAQGNLSSVGGDAAERGLAARERLRQTLGVRALLRGYQVHGSTVGRVLANGERPGLPGALDGKDSTRQPPLEADGHAVAAPGMAAMVLTADCIPVVLACEGAAAALHAGWRGLAAGVLDEGVRALREVGGRGEIAAVVGPCAGACCYEVGEEVHAAFAGADRDGRLIDLRAIAHETLLAAGVAQVADLDACTICDERFFSHRREGPRAGRQAGIAWVAR